MNDTSPLLLIGIGTAGCAIARGVNRAYGEGLRYLLVDTDASTGGEGDPFLLLGGDRLSGRGAGGDTVAAGDAAQESIRIVDERIEGVRMAVVVTALGGGTGSGVTLEVLRHLSERGIPSAVFATVPFAFEGEARLKNANSFMPIIEEEANATFFLPLDRLVQGEDNMVTAMRRAVDTVATGVTLFWRLVTKPGYLRLDAERIRHLLIHAGRGRFAAVSARGPDRAAETIDRLVRSELLAGQATPARSILCGILAGDDLRLTEIGQVASALRAAFGDRLPFNLGTVNDEVTFSGRLSVVVMLFEENAKGDPSATAAATPSPGRRSHRPRAITLAPGPTGRGRFNNAEPTFWNGEDLDIPTFLRRNINLDF